MGITVLNNSDLDEVRPICNDCGILLCWGISITEYEEREAFWNAWRCEYCIKYEEDKKYETPRPRCCDN